MAFVTTFCGLLFLADLRRPRVEFTPLDEMRRPRDGAALTRAMNAHAPATADLPRRPAVGIFILRHVTAAAAQVASGLTRKPMHRDALFARYAELRDYVGWTEADAELVASIGPRLEPHLDAIIRDFYDTIARHPGARKVLTGGDAQVERLKTTLRRWIGDLFAGHYDADYVERRWRVGLRHAEIGLEQVYCNVALCRIRTALQDALHREWDGEPSRLRVASLALGKLLDLDLAMIEHAYQTEHTARQQQIERLATLGQIAGGVAHELRNPLNVVKTSVYYLLHARSPSPEKSAEHFDRIERHVGLADGVITALSNFARMPVPEARPFAVDACMKEALDLADLPETIEVSLDGLDRLPAVAADAGQIRIVFSNLIRNAVEAMAGNGKLSLKGRTDDGFAEVVVADSGPGIPVDQLPRIMEPFFTTKARGLGLGLAISRSIVDKNRGELRVASEPGRGSSFAVRLRIAP
jgi:signal transduction histidine kinase